jgi:hypothetical protein
VSGLQFDSSLHQEDSKNANLDVQATYEHNLASVSLGAVHHFSNDPLEFRLQVATEKPENVHWLFSGDAKNVGEDKDKKKLLAYSVGAQVSYVAKSHEAVFEVLYKNKPQKK